MHFHYGWWNNHFCALCTITSILVQNIYLFSFPSISKHWEAMFISQSYVQCLSAVSRKGWNCPPTDHSIRTTPWTVKHCCTIKCIFSSLYYPFFLCEIILLVLLLVSCFLCIILWCILPPENFAYRLIELFQ